MSQENFLEYNRPFDSGDRNNGKPFFKKGKGCPFCGSGAKVIDYKDPDDLGSFISEGGRMLPSRITSVCASHQRKLKKVIKHSRTLALLPFVYTSK